MDTSAFAIERRFTAISCRRGNLRRERDDDSQARWRKTPRLPPRPRKLRRRHSPRQLPWQPISLPIVAASGTWTYRPSGLDWTGWGSESDKLALPACAGRELSAAAIPASETEMGFGIPNVRIVRSQPAVYRGQSLGRRQRRHRLLARRLRTGCTFWATKAGSPIRSGIIVGRRRASSKPFSSATPAATFTRSTSPPGKLLWAKRADDHPNATITGTPTFYDGRLYVPVSSGEEGARRRAEYECCTFRGSVVALDAATGKKIWQGYMATDAPAAVGKTKDGHNIFAPSGMAIWSAPTIDIVKHRIYVGTGDNYSEPGTKTSDAVVALDMDTGKILWSRQFDKDDVYKIDCGDPPRAGCSPPTNPEFDLGASPILVDLGHKKRAPDPRPEKRPRLRRRSRRARENFSGTRAPAWAVCSAECSGAPRPTARTSTSPFPISRSKAARPIQPKAAASRAYRVSDGKLLWKTPPPGCGDRRPCSPAQSQAVTAIPGAVFSGSIDGHLRAYATADGKIIWDFDTARDFDTVNKVAAHGGSLDVGGPIVAGGMVFVVSGYPGFGAMPGNVLLAFAAK